MMAWSGLPQNVRLSEWLGISSGSLIHFGVRDRRISKSLRSPDPQADVL